MVDGSFLPRSIRWRIQLGLLDVPEYPFNEIEFLAKLTELNRDSLTEQRSRYETLVDLHFTHLEENDSEDEEAQDQDDDDDDESLPSEKEEEHGEEEDLSLDPLTAMMMEQEAREKRRQELDLKYRKEKARRKRGLAVEAENDDMWKDENFSPKQTLSVIAKDLNRLQPEHHTYHHSRKNLSQHHGDNNNTGSDTVNGEQQETQSQSSFEISVKERTEELSQILTVHAMEHPEMGYRQGMHEICSYLMLVVEMDLFDMETVPNKTAINTFNKKSFFFGGGSDKKATEMDLTDHSREEVHLVQSDFILDEPHKLHDVYTMFEKVMDQLARAYDVSNESGQTTSMEIMGRSVVSKLRTVACDQVLFKFVSRLSFPPQLYCTRWIRLMFSREVTGWRNVLLLWDVFFDFITACPYIYTLKTDEKAILASLGQFQLQDVLENTAASMILMVRMKLLKTQDPNESIQILMNYEPFLDVSSLSETLQSMMQRLYAKDGFTPIRPASSTTTSSGDSNSGKDPGSSREHRGNATMNMLMGAMQSMDSSFRDLMNSSRKSMTSEDSSDDVIGTTPNKLPSTTAEEEEEEEEGQHLLPASKTPLASALSTAAATTPGAFDTTCTGPSHDLDPLLGVMPTPNKVMTGVGGAKSAASFNGGTTDPWDPLSVSTPKPKETLLSSLRRLVQTKEDETSMNISTDPAAAATDYIHVESSSNHGQPMTTTSRAAATASDPAASTIAAPVVQPRDAFADFAESTGLFEPDELDAPDDLDKPDELDKADEPSISSPLTSPSEKLRPAKPYKPDPETSEDEIMSQWVLADKLNRSMLCIQNYLTSGQPSLIVEEQGKKIGNLNGTASSNVPGDVWEALAEIDVVRKQLLRTEADLSGHARSQHNRSQTALTGMIV